MSHPLSHWLYYISLLNITLIKLLLFYSNYVSSILIYTKRFSQLPLIFTECVMIIQRFLKLYKQGKKFIGMSNNDSRMI